MAMTEVRSLSIDMPRSSGSTQQPHQWREVLGTMLPQQYDHLSPPGVAADFSVYDDQRGDEGVFCDLCGKRFYRKQNLINHKREVHDKMNVVTCELCGAEACNKYNLARHMRTKHSDSRNHTCHECGKSFKLRHHMTRHIMNRSCADSNAPSVPPDNS
ncbi:uncharacterized protein LOC144884156 [Branchiostoma floridae x Branchiostoma japonicum]